MTCSGTNIDIHDIVWMFYSRTSSTPLTIWSNNSLTTGSSNRYDVNTYYNAGINYTSTVSGIPNRSILTTTLHIYRAVASDSGTYVCSCNNMKPTCSSTTVAKVALSVCKNNHIFYIKIFSIN